MSAAVDTAKHPVFSSPIDVANELKSDLTNAIEKLAECIELGRALKRHDSNRFRQLKAHAEKTLKNLKNRARAIVHEVLQEFIQLFEKAHQHQGRRQPGTIRTKHACTH